MQCHVPLWWGWMFSISMLQDPVEEINLTLGSSQENPPVSDHEHCLLAPVIHEHWVMHWPPGSQLSLTVEPGVTQRLGDCTMQSQPDHWLNIKEKLQGSSEFLFWNCMILHGSFIKMNCLIIIYVCTSITWI